MSFSSRSKAFSVIAAACLLLTCSTAFTADNAQVDSSSSKQGYAIVATPSVLDDADWNKVVEALQTKYADEFKVDVIKWDDDSAFDKLREVFPKYACFVVKPEEATVERLATVWNKTRELDDDPYGDVIWAIITGYDSADALRLTQVKPMTVESACGATSIASKYFKSCVVFDEGKKNHWRVKEDGKEEDRNDAPDDTTYAIAEALNSAQLFVTSGHASENNWSIGYAYKNGFFVAQDGKLIGAPSNDKPFLVEASGSKIHLACGNCLWGNINKRDCMVLMMIRHANVDMFMGYVVPTWFGYMGWGVMDYYVEQPGRFTVAEAFYANNQALMNLLVNDKKARENNAPKSELLPDMKREGLEYDANVVVLYGDPAWQNALAVQESGWKQSLESEKAEDGSTVWTFTVDPSVGDESFKLADANGSERSNRPIFQLLPNRVSNVEIIEGQEYEPVITDNFILVSVSKAIVDNKPCKIKFLTK